MNDLPETSGQAGRRCVPVGVALAIATSILVLFVCSVDMARLLLSEILPRYSYELPDGARMPVKVDLLALRPSADGGHPAAFLLWVLRDPLALVAPGVRPARFFEDAGPLVTVSDNPSSEWFLPVRYRHALPEGDRPLSEFVGRTVAFEGRVETSVFGGKRIVVLRKYHPFR